MSKSYFCSTAFGLYECENWTYDTTVPVWTHVGDVIGIDEFAIDLNDPEEFQAGRDGTTIYIRRPTAYGDDNWDSKFTRAAAEAIVGESLTNFGWVEINNAPGKEGHIYTRARTTRGFPTDNDMYLFRSADYGETWGLQGSVYGDMSVLRDAGGIWAGRVTGNTMYAMINYGFGGNCYVYYSIDEGINWALKGGGSLGISVWLSRVLIDPSAEATSFVGMYTNAPDLARGRTVDGLHDGVVEAGAGIGVYYGYGGGWISAHDSKYIRVAKDTTLDYSDEGGDAGTWGERSIVVPGSGIFEKAIWGWDKKPENVGVAIRTGASDAYPQSLVSTDDLGVNWHMKSGAHASTDDTGGGDSIPWNCGGVAENGLYLVNPGDVYTSVVAMRTLPTAGTVYADGVQMGTLATGSTIYSHGVEQENPRP